MKSFKGMNGTLHVGQTMLTIQYEKGHSLMGRKDIPFEQIKEVYLRNGGLFKFYYLQIVCHGDERTSKKIMGHPNTVVFSFKDEELFEEAKAYIEKKVDQVDSGISPEPLNEEFVFKAYNGLLTVSKTLVIIDREGRVGKRTIDIQAITGIDVRKPKWQMGYIQLAIEGSQEYMGLNRFKTFSDKNVLMIKDERQYEDFLYAKELIMKNKESFRQSFETSIFSTADEIRKYSNLYEDGVITKEEFEAKKKQILGI